MVCSACFNDIGPGLESRGRPGWCKACYAREMSAYMRRRRSSHRERAMLDRARERARTRGLTFSLAVDDIYIPQRCVIRGIPLAWGEGRRGPDSPSLDRVDADRGYTPDNVRVISDAANRWKGDMSIAQLARRAARGAPGSRYGRLVEYVERANRTEMLLAQLAARLGPRGASETVRIGRFLRSRELGSH